MAPIILFSLLSLLLIPASCNEEGFIYGVISEKGLDSAKDLLIEKGIESIVKFQLPEIEKSGDVPFVGNAKVVLSELRIENVQINSSSVKVGESGIVLAVSGGSANLSMKWRYSCSSRLFPIGISDRGTASVKVKGIQMRVTVNLRNQEGTLMLNLSDYRCNVRDLSIKLDGGTSWLYQLLVDAFQRKIASAIEDAISDKIKEGISKLDNILQSLPRQITLDKTSSLNVSLIGNPVLTDSFVAIAINGLFNLRNEALTPQGYQKGSEISAACGALPKMIKVSIHENVFKSASLLYFNAGKMQLIVDKLPNKTILNTAEWKFIIPQLYKQYPNDQMKLNISASSPPIIQVTNQNIDATISLDITIGVLEHGEVIPVACISVEVIASFAVEISGKILAGRIIGLENFSTYLKWSKIGNFHMHPVQRAMSSALKTQIIPYLNFKLKRGIPLPFINGFGFQNANILYIHPWISMCSDVSFLKDY